MENEQQPVVTEQSPRKNPFKVATIILSVVALSLAGLSVFQFLNKDSQHDNVANSQTAPMQNKSETSKATTPSNEKQQEVVQANTISSNEYQPQKLPFTFTRPGDGWSINDKGVGSNSYFPGDMQPCGGPILTYSREIEILRYHPYIFIDYKVKGGDGAWCFSYGSWGDTTSQRSVKGIEVKTSKRKLFDFKPQQGISGDFYSDVAFFKSGDNSIAIEAIYDVHDKERTQKTLDGILSTFREIKP